MSRIQTIVLFLIMIGPVMVQAQREQPSLYDPSLNGSAEISKMVEQARAEGKHVLLQVGGNW